MVGCQFRRGSLLCLLLLVHLSSRPVQAELEGFSEEATLDYGSTVNLPSSQPASTSGNVWDDEEFEGFESKASKQPVEAPATDPTPDEVVSRPAYETQEHYYYEILGAVLLAAYGINIFIGKGKNETSALAWARTYATPGSIMERNFSLIGAGDTVDAEVLMKESNSLFKFYCSGRRHCQSLLATIDLKPRHDLIKSTWHLISPRPDIINIEAKMNETSMPPIVLAVGIPEMIKIMPRVCDDLQVFTKQISVPKDRLRYWPSQQLQVLTEHSSVFYDIFSDPRVEAVFSGPLDHFRSLHFTSEGPEELGKRLLRFSFVLPPPDQMQSLQRLMAIIPIFIDIVGAYKMSAEVSKKANKTRAELAERAFKDSRAQRQEQLQAKKMERIQAERERIARMTPESRAKWEEKQQRAASKSSVRFKMQKA